MLQGKSFDLALAVNDNPVPCRRTVNHNFKPKEDVMKRYIDSYELSKMLGCSVWSIRTWTNQKLLPREPGFGRLVRFDPERIEAWLKAGGLEAARAEKARKKTSKEKELLP